MPREDANHAHLWDMWQAACDIDDFVSGMSFADFAQDKRTRYAVERQLLVVGEAAGRVSEDLRRNHPEIPWGSIVGLRNVLDHEYGEILVERIWIVARRDVPELIHHLELLLPGTPGAPGTEGRSPTSQ